MRNFFWLVHVRGGKLIYRRLTGLFFLDIDKIFLKDGEGSESSSTVAAEHSPERKDSEKRVHGGHVEQV